MQDPDRADVYALLAMLWLEPQGQALAALPGAPPWPAPHLGDAARAWSALQQAAERCAHSAADEFGALFVSAGNPRLNPYECFYVAGCLMDKPLALLRSDLQALGLARREGATELEDHLGALCEAMRLLIERGADTLQQAGFFERHLGGWAGACLDDTRHAAGADFYRALADFTGAFFAAEAGRFGLEPVAVAGEGPTAHQRRTGALQP